MKKGFTLVELAIVLVIIGLLIGGILVAQSLVGTARLHRFVAELGQYNAAVKNFETKYQSLPGDSVLISGQGDNDGLIELDPPANGPTWFNSSESVYFWSDLLATGFSYKYSAFTYWIAGTQHAPKVNIGNNNNLAIIAAANPLIDRVNYFYVAACNAGGDNGELYCEESLTAKDSFSIDKKLDDGIATTGIVRSVSNYYLYTAGSCAGGEDYDLSYGDSYLCQLKIEMGK